MPAPASWRAWSAFLRSPALPDRADPGLARGLKALLPLFALDLAIMAVLLGSIGLALQLGFEMPEHLLGEIDLTPGMIGFIVIGAPIGEEILFRGWLSGRPGHLIATPLTIVALLTFLGAGAAFNAGSGSALPLLGAGALAAMLAILALAVFRKRPAVAWFQRRFGWFFWGSAIAFAAIHLSNFAAGGAALLPMILPQFALALLLGYLRVKHGLWSSVLLHMLHNSLFISLVLAGAG
ncbi:CAAX amino terminal protease self- immunity [Tsuneonella dongtanensis]|uniref:CAAX amino terminal protease self-immunity n=1 Tax=Tsuneonella dongtanensis TaxID=692370 RepID=A0A1B2AAU3_9SPHN|nr:CPBP family glutamic-type intramembrane protease [Tsuneonella dongtanensis]ANY19293.1 CAAX amino terminal protease self- immunity [Tsuneonella dongtanensis]